MRQLIVNADGFGFTFGNNRAILEVLEHGFIRSVSVNVTWPAVKDVETLVRNFPHVTVGVHLNLSVGPPILPAEEIPSLVGGNGEFHGPDFKRRAYKGLLDADEMKRELRAQIDTFRQMGVTITHWDSHQGRHLYPGFFDAVLDVACDEGIRASRTHRYWLVLPPGWRSVRWLGYYRRHPRCIISHPAAAWRMRAVRRAGFRIPDRRLVLGAFGKDSPYRTDAWQALLDQAPDGVNFVECHPGYVDEDLKRYSTWLAPREKERELFSDPDWLNRAREAGVEVVSYDALLE